ncbi:MAG: hypothetical protein V4539_16435 [Bacteroidota bacterium]
MENQPIKLILSHAAYCQLLQLLVREQLKQREHKSRPDLLISHPVEFPALQLTVLPESVKP